MGTPEDTRPFSREGQTLNQCTLPWSARLGSACSGWQRLLASVQAHCKATILSFSAVKTDASLVFSRPWE